MSGVFQVQTEGAVFITSQKDLDLDDFTFALFSRLLRGTSKDSTFSIFEKIWGERWNKYHDTVFPYGDRRQAHYHTVFTFDLDNDNLFFTKAETAGQIPLSVLRQRRITLEDFTSYSPSHAPHIELDKNFPPSYWNPVLYPLPRMKLFTYRLLNDFNHQWRHILRNRYNDFTFRQLITAIIRLATVNFKIVELDEPERCFYLRERGAYVTMLHLPTYLGIRTLDSRSIMQVGRVHIMATQDPADAIPLIRKHFNSQTHNSIRRSFA